jgi:Tfp pilus assembly protein PilE
VSTCLLRGHDLWTKLTWDQGASPRRLLFVLIFGTISVIGILAAIALPAYQDYTVRAKLAEAAVVAKNASSSVERYYFQYKQIPSTIEETGFTTPRNPSYSGISVDSQNGVVSVLMATSPIQGKSLLMVPSQATDGTLTWTCQSADIPQKYLPQGCRQ